MANLFIVLLAVLLQILAAGLAFRVNRIAGRPIAWILISTALVLMAARRLYALIELVRLGSPERLLPNELVGLVISILMLAGILLIQGIFQSKATQTELLKQATAQARDEADRLLAVMAASPIPLWIAEDPRCQVIQSNPAAGDLLRRSAAVQSLGGGSPGSEPGSIRLIQGEHALAQEESPLQRACLRGEDVRDEPLDLLCHDGEVRHLMGYATPLRHADGQIHGAVSSLVDVTDLRRVELALRASERMVQQNAARLGALVRLGQMTSTGIREVLDFGLDEAVALTESKLGYIYFYDEAKQEFTLFSWSKEVMEACKILEKQTTYHLDKTGLWGEAVRQRRPILVNEFTAPHPHKKGYPEGHAELHRFMTVPLFRGDRIVAVVGVGNKKAPYGDQDVEQLNEFMNGLWSIVERRKAEEALAKSQKMESLGLLAGGLAHDFNNIFQSMVANLELAEVAIPEGARGHAYITRLKASLDRASRLSRDILHYSGGELRRPETLDLSPVVAETLERMGLTVLRDLSPHLPKVMVDPLLIGRVVEGLVTNAKEANVGQGVVRVRTYRRVVVPSDLGTGHWPEPVEPGIYAVLEVSDQGHGIDTATLPMIFDPFFSTRELGRGLGLPAALGIVRGHRGGIQVESLVGVGSVFRVHLPSPEGQLVATVVPTTEARARHLVLLADDEVELRMVLAEMMEDWFGMEVVQAADGQEALELFTQRPEAFDVVLLDATMPRLGGVEAFTAMRAIRPGLPGILCSGYAQPVSRDQAQAQGFADFLKKPFSSAELETLLDRVMGAQTL